MPTDTFFRLPEEKRARILEGAWSEFTAVPYAEASINRIVQTSRIPRGSFYQYFEDKNDLFLTLIDEISFSICSMIRSNARAETCSPCPLCCSTPWSPRAAASRRRFPAPSRC